MCCLDNNTIVGSTQLGMGWVEDSQHTLTGSNCTLVCQKGSLSVGRSHTSSMWTENYCTLVWTPSGASRSVRYQGGVSTWDRWTMFLPAKIWKPNFWPSLEGRDWDMPYSGTEGEMPKSARLRSKSAQNVYQGGPGTFLHTMSGVLWVGIVVNDFMSWMPLMLRYSIQ